MGSRRKTQRDNFLAEVACLEHGINPYEPTSAMPGSAEKVAVLAKRVVYGLPLWREDDPCLKEICLWRSRRPLAWWRSIARHSPLAIRHSTRGEASDLLLPDAPDLYGGSSWRLSHLQYEARPTPTVS